MSTVVPVVFQDYPAFLPNLEILKLSPEEAAIRQINQYQPVGILKLLHQNFKSEESSKLEKILCEELTRDVLQSFNAEIKTCVRTLCKLKLTCEQGQIISKMTFGQLLRIPRCKETEFGIVSVMVDLCKITNINYPLHLSGYLHEIFFTDGYNRSSSHGCFDRMAFISSNQF
jgi:hypothetical protein